jgi:folate-binding protein YgfZ
MSAPADLTDDFEASYRALRGDGGAVAIERDAVRVVGPQAEEFLQGQLSQDVASMAPATSRSTFLLQPNGKVDAWMRIGRLGDDGFILDVDGGFGPDVHQRLERFKLRTKATIELVEGWSWLAVRAAIEPVRPSTVHGFAFDVVWPGLRGFDLVGPPDVHALDLPVVSSDAYEAVRIECGVPKMGAELTESTIPAEAGQWVIDTSVSFTKGCYTGQELVARIDSRGGNVPRQLRGVVVDGEQPPVGARVAVDDADVGSLTSVSRAPASDRSIALAYIARKVVPPADATVVWKGGQVRARIEALPLV